MKPMANLSTATVVAILLVFSSGPRAVLAAPGTEVELTTSDGVKLKATLYEPAGGGEAKPAVVALHGAGQDRSEWENLGPEFTSRNITLLAVDLRGHGGSGKPEGAEGEALNAGMVNDVAAAAAHLRESVLADGKKIGLLGEGLGGSVAVLAALKDVKIATVACFSPEPDAVGLPVLRDLKGWNDRPLAFAGTQKGSGDAFRKIERLLKTIPSAEIISLPGDAKGAEIFSKVPEAALVAAQWFNGVVNRPVLDGKPDDMQVRESQGPGHIVMEQKSAGMGCASGGGILASGYSAPDAVEGAVVLADPDPAAKALTEKSRRLTLLPGPGKGLSVQVKIEKWTGKSWKSDRTVVLTGAGGFATDRNITCYEIWLSPSLLGVTPFTEIAVASCLLKKGAPTFETESKEGVQDLGHFGDGEPEERIPFSPENPASWSHLTLQ